MWLASGAQLPIIDGSAVRNYSGFGRGNLSILENLSLKNT